MMYDKLIRQLRNCAIESAPCKACDMVNDDSCTDGLMKQAADAIAELICEAADEHNARLDAEERHRWIKFVLRPLTEEEQREHPDWCYILDCRTPDDGQEILVSDGRYVWTDTFYQDGDQCYLDGDAELESCWWQPMPEPPKEE